MDVGVSVHPNNAYWADGCGVTVDRANGETEDGKQFWQPNRIKSILQSHFYFLSRETTYYNKITINSIKIPACVRFVSTVSFTIKLIYLRYCRLSPDA